MVRVAVIATAYPKLKVWCITSLPHTLKIYIAIISNILHYVNYVFHAFCLDLTYILANIFCINQQSFAMNIDNQIFL